MKTPLTCLVILILVASCSRRAEMESVPEPTSNGTKLSAWLEQVQQDGSGAGALTEPAKEAIRNFGPSALPWLAHELIAEESSAAHLRHYYGDGQTAYNRNDAALRAFLVLGPDAAPAVSNIAPIFKVLDNYSNARYCAISALWAIGPQGVPVLLTGLKHPDSATREKCAEALGAIEPPVTEAVPDLIVLLDDADPRVRAASAEALGQIHAEPQTVVPALLKAFRTAPELIANPPPIPTVVNERSSHKPKVVLVKRWVLNPGEKADFLRRIQVAAVKALGQYGPEAKEALPDFRAYLQKPAPTDPYEESSWRSVRSAVAKAVTLIASPTPAPASKPKR